MAKKRELTEDDILNLLDEWEDKCKETNTNTLVSNNDGGIDHISKISDHEFSDDIVDEFSQTQGSVNDLHISK